MAVVSFDRARAERAVRELLLALGFDPDEAELLETPARVAQAYGEELLRGYAEDPAQIIVQGSEPLGGETPDPVLVEGLELVTVCPHHLLVGQGKATVAYWPGERLLGLGALARLVDALGRRLTLQERIAGQVVDALMTHAGARGAFCRVELEHACLRTRGPEEHGAVATSWAARGELSDPRLLEVVLGRRFGAAEP